MAGRQRGQPKLRPCWNVEKLKGGSALIDRPDLPTRGYVSQPSDEKFLADRSVNIRRDLFIFILGEGLFINERGAEF